MKEFKVLILISCFLFGYKTFAFSKNMHHYKLSFNQKRKVSELKELIENLNLSSKSKSFYQSIVSEYSNNELPMLEFKGSRLIFKYQNQKSAGEINIEKDILLIGENKISIENYTDSKSLYVKINNIIAQKEGDAFLMFLTSESQEKTSLLDSKLQALFWAMSTEYAKVNKTKPKLFGRDLASEK
jgi:hypothetical protein